MLNEFNLYGVRLRTLETDNSELVRVWRQSPHVADYLFPIKPISQEDQINWFNAIPSHHYYFVIFDPLSKFDRPVGLVSIKKDSLNSDIAEGGLFIGESSAQNSMVGFQAILAYCDIAFNCKNIDKLYAWIYPQNRRAIRANIAVGFERSDSTNEYGAQLFTLTRDKFGSSIDKYKNFFM